MNVPPESALPGLVACAQQVQGTVISQRQLARGTFAIRLHAPEIARAITPGQFFMIRPATGNEPLLGRPFALYDTVAAEGQAEEFEFAYHVIGKMTELMSHWQGGETVQLWGPLGNGFPVYTGQHLLCVGGGIGYTPFLAVARETLGLRRYGSGERTTSPQQRRVTLCYGSRDRQHRADLSDFGDLPGLELKISTDDGSEGHHGFVTDLVSQSLSEEPRPFDTLVHGERSNQHKPNGVYCCGPEPMMHAVAKICRAANVPCWLSLETPMACGFGACFSCVTRIDLGDGEWDYRRTCVEGPVFPAHLLAIP